jgi:hypothetical protein
MHDPCHCKTLTPQLDSAINPSIVCTRYLRHLHPCNHQCTDLALTLELSHSIGPGCYSRNQSVILHLPDYTTVDCLMSHQQSPTIKRETLFVSTNPS